MSHSISISLHMRLRIFPVMRVALGCLRLAIAYSKILSASRDHRPEETNTYHLSVWYHSCSDIQVKVGEAKTAFEFRALILTAPSEPRASSALARDIAPSPHFLFGGLEDCASSQIRAFRLRSEFLLRFASFQFLRPHDRTIKLPTFTAPRTSHSLHSSSAYGSGK